MVKPENEVTFPLFENIQAQPDSLGQVADFQLGQGRDALESCAELLRASRSVILTGMGASLFACIPLSYQLAARGVSVRVIESSELLYFLTPTLDEHTTVLLVSRSGESVEVTKLLPILNDRRCRTIGVFNVPGSTLDKKTERPIFVNSPADELVAIQTYTGTLAALSMLGAAYGNELDAAQGEINETISILPRLITECSSLCKSRNDFTAGQAPLYLLGRGAALASVAEGVLLMHETAKAPAVGMSSPQFRHGPVEAVHSGFRAIVFGSQGSTYDLDRGLARDLTGMGANVSYIGPGALDPGIIPLCTWPQGAARRFTSILEIIPIQLLAYQTALDRGITPGKFRYAPAITTTEVGFLQQTS